MENFEEKAKGCPGYFVGWCTVVSEKCKEGNCIVLYWQPKLPPPVDQMVDRWCVAKTERVAQMDNGE